MNKLIFLYCFCFYIGVSHEVEDISTRARMIEPTEYLRKVFQETFFELERVGFSNLDLVDFNQTLNEVMYNWHVEGVAMYTNGFLVSVQKVHVDRMLGSVRTQASGTIASFGGVIHLMDCKVGYDVTADLGEGGIHRFTGTYTHTNIQIEYSLTKNINTDEFTLFATTRNVGAGVGVRMIYMPESSVSEVLSRRFVASSTFNNVDRWSRNVINPIMLEKARQIEFPELCLNC